MTILSEILKAEPTDECVYWPGCLNRDGYGVTHGGYAHRFVYELMVAPIQSGLELDHLCHTRDLTCVASGLCRHRSCVNPRHLEPVTHAENVSRGEKSRKTECSKGHPFSEANTYIRTNRGGEHRECRTCGIARTRKYLLKKAGA